VNGNHNYGNHYGDNINQSGSHNTINKNTSYGGDPQTAFQEMIAAVTALRARVAPDDRQAIDESMRVIGDGRNVEPGRMKRALATIMGVATMVGQVGAPVIEAVRKVMSALGVA
jgi:hypothetical protein